MQRFIVRRLFYMVFAVIATTMVVFGLSRLAGDPRYLYLKAHATQEMWDAWGKEMGLDKPLLVQYFVWISKAVRGDWGRSLRSGSPAFKVVIQRVPATLELALASFLFVLLTGVPLGVLSAVKRASVWDYAGRTFALFGQALPPFWLGIMLMLLFALQLGWLPVGTRGGVKNYIMPAITLGWLPTAAMLRLVRSAMLEVLDSEYVKLARAKGVAPWLIIWKHAFKNAMISPLTFGALLLASFLMGTVVTETVFAWPGMGRLAVEAVFQNDFPVMVGCVLVFTLLFLLANMMVDIGYAYLDPRIRYS